MAFLQRGKLLERQRVDLAEGREVPFGLFEPLFLFLTDERLALDDLAAVLVHRSAQGGPFVFPCAGRHRDGLVRTVVGHELVGRQPEVLDALEFQRFDPQPLLGAGEFVAVHGVGQFGQFAGQGVVAAADRGKVAFHLFPAFLGAVPFPPGQLHGDIDEPDHLLHGRSDGGGAARPGARGGGPVPRLPRGRGARWRRRVPVRPPGFVWP